MEIYFFTFEKKDWESRLLGQEKRRKNSAEEEFLNYFKVFQIDFLNTFLSIETLFIQIFFF